MFYSSLARFGGVVFCVLLLALVPSSLVHPLDEEVAPDPQELYIRAQDEVAAKRPEAASRLLHDAVLALGAQPPTPVNDELAKQWEKEGKKLDKRFLTRRNTERKFAKRFVAVAQEYVESGFPTCSELFIAEAYKLDPRSTHRIAADAKAVQLVRDPDSAPARLDARRCELLEMLCRSVSVHGERGLEPEDKLDAKAIDVYRDAAPDFVKIAKAYHQAKWLEIAFEVIAQARYMEPAPAKELQKEIGYQLDIQRAAVRWKKYAKPHMQDFRKKHRVLGKERSWVVGDKEIVTPGAGEHRALIVSKRALPDEYRIEVDVKIGPFLRPAVLVFAFQDQDDFLAAEFVRNERPHQIRFLHFQGDRRRKLAECEIPISIDTWHELNLTVQDGTAVLTYADVSLPVELPIPAAGPFGFLRHAETRMPPKSTLAQHAITFRNLVVTTPDAPTRD